MVEGKDQGDSPLRLDYGRAPPRLRKIIRRTLIAFCVLAIALAGWYWGPPAWKTIQLRYAWRQCLTYSLPPDVVVYEGDPAAATLLLTRPHYAAAAFLPNLGSRDLILPNPPPAIAAHRPAMWDRLVNLAGIPHPPPFSNRSKFSAICFMGELQSPSGERRLVVVECSPLQQGPDATVGGISGVSISPAAAAGAGAYVQSDIQWLLGNPLAIEPSSLRIFAGQHDPKDPSRFTIRYQVYGQEQVLDGWLGDAGRVHLQPRQPGGGQRWMRAPGSIGWRNTVSASDLLTMPSAWHQQLRRVQQQCLDYAPSPDQIVFTDDRSIVYEAGSTISTQLTRTGYLYFKGMAKVWFIPPVWQDLMTVAGIPEPAVLMGDSRAAGFVAIERNPGPLTPTCFLGELSTTSGLRKLVVVDYVRATDQFYGGRSPTSAILQAFSIEPATPMSPPGPMVLSPSIARLAQGWEGSPFDLTIYAGQRDPEDPSRFTIRYSVSGRSSSVEGKLKEDGHVDLTPAFQKIPGR